MPPGLPLDYNTPVPFPVSGGMMNAAALPGMVPMPGMHMMPWMNPEGGMGMMHGDPSAVPQMQLQLMPDGSIVQVPMALPTAVVPQPRWLDENGLMVYQTEPLKVD